MMDDDKDDAEILPRPSRIAALEAVALLEWYISVLEEQSSRICLCLLAAKRGLKRLET
jgi:hypothetical protein